MDKNKPTKTTDRSIGSISSLCEALEISEEDLSCALNIPNEDKYRSITITKKNNKKRVVYKPHWRIRIIQRRIKERLFSNFEWPSHLYGSIPNQEHDKQYYSRDYIACATRHCSAKSVLSIDIENFFGNIHKERVKDIFRRIFKYNNELSDVLAEICTYNNAVVQGGLTSSYLANLALFKESDAIEKLTRKGLTYTRLVDDITVSTHQRHYNFDYAIKVVQQMLLGEELPVNNEKTKIQYTSSKPIMIHNLRIGFKEPRLPSDEVARIRAATHNIEKLAAVRNYRTSFSYRKDFNRCMGRVNKLSRVNHNQHKPLLNRLQKVLPLPSKNDLLKAKSIVKELEAQFPTKGGMFWYRRRFNRLWERVNVVGRTYQFSATRLRERMKLIRPLN